MNPVSKTIEWTKEALYPLAPVQHAATTALGVGTVAVAALKGTARAAGGALSLVSAPFRGPVALVEAAAAPAEAVVDTATLVAGGCVALSGAVGMASDVVNAGAAVKEMVVERTTTVSKVAHLAITTGVVIGVVVAVANPAGAAAAAAGAGKLLIGLLIAL